VHVWPISCVVTFIMSACRSMASRLLLVAAVAMASSGAAAVKLPLKPAKPVIYGTYAVECRGYYSGTLNATVSPGLVMITGDVTAEDGKKATFIASAPLVGYRFTGVATTVVGAITLTGRVDPSDEVIPKPRLTCTWVTVAGQGG